MTNNIQRNSGSQEGREVVGGSGHHHQWEVRETSHVSGLKKCAEGQLSKQAALVNLVAEKKSVKETTTVQEKILFAAQVACPYSKTQANCGNESTTVSADQACQEIITQESLFGELVEDWTQFVTPAQALALKEANTKMAISNYNAQENLVNETYTSQNERLDRLHTTPDAPSFFVRHSEAQPASSQPDFMRETLEAIEEGFAANLDPSLSQEGTSGTYFLRQSQEKPPVAVFKPIDEEAYAPNNPREMKGPFGSDTCRPGIKSGESTIREVTAYLLDHEGFSGVPRQSLVELSYPKFGGDASEEVLAPRAILDRLSESNQHGAKIGALAEYVNTVGPAENFSSDLFSVDDVHKIAVLDLRLMNLDRNDQNILVTKPAESSKNQNLRLVPIDHGLTIPDSLEVCSFDLVWLSYDQASMPFSTKTLSFIESLDIDSDIALLEQQFDFRPICLRNIKVSTMLLKKAANLGLNLSDIGSILCRPDEDDSLESHLEKIVRQARRCAGMTRSLLKKALRQQTQLTRTARRGKLTKFDPFKCVAFKNAQIVMSEQMDTDSDEEESPLPKPSSPKNADGSFNSVFFTSDEEEESMDMGDEPSDAVTTYLNTLNAKKLLAKAEKFANKKEGLKTPLSKKSEDGPHDYEFFVAFEELLDEALKMYTTQQS